MEGEIVLLSGVFLKFLLKFSKVVQEVVRLKHFGEFYATSKDLRALGHIVWKKGG